MNREQTMNMNPCLDKILVKINNLFMNGGLNDDSRTILSILHSLVTLRRPTLHGQLQSLSREIIASRDELEIDNNVITLVNTAITCSLRGGGKQTRRRRKTRKTVRN
jgi:hypothetical protein